MLSIAVANRQRLPSENNASDARKNNPQLPHETRDKFPVRPLAEKLFGDEEKLP